MASLNKVMLIGRLGQDPEKVITPSGAIVVNVSLATTEYSKAVYTQLALYTQPVSERPTGL